MKKQLAIFLIGLSVILALSSCSQPYSAEKDDAKSITRTYSTDFPFEENPISENGHWLNGAVDGLDWGNVATKPGLAYGLQDGAISFSDGTALLKGPWRSDQTVEATVYILVANAGDYPEVELRLRSSLSSHNCSGYEVLWGVAENNPYLQIVIWNGALGDFTYLYNRQSDGYGSSSQYAVKHGDVVKATIVGNVITAYINGAQKAQVSDDTFTTGNPGMGFNFVGGEDSNSPQDGYGFTSFSATDELKQASHTE